MSTRAFRITRDELAIRPIWHHKEDRVQAHLLSVTHNLVCFLAHLLVEDAGPVDESVGFG